MSKPFTRPTLEPFNSQPVDDLGGIHLLIVLIAVNQNSIQILVHFTHTKYSGQFRKHPPQRHETFQFLSAVF